MEVWEPGRANSIYRHNPLERDAVSCQFSGVSEAMLVSVGIWIAIKIVHKQFAILHSNEVPGDFRTEVKDGKPGKMVDGLSLLSG